MQNDGPGIDNYEKTAWPDVLGLNVAIAIKKI